MELFNYYSLDECKARDKVISKLNELKDQGKIDYEMISTDVFKIDDIDLDESEIDELSDILDDEEVFPYLDYDDEGEDYDYDDDDGENDDY